GAPPPGRPDHVGARLYRGRNSLHEVDGPVQAGQPPALPDLERGPGSAAGAGLPQGGRADRAAGQRDTGAAEGLSSRAIKPAARARVSLRSPCSRFGLTFEARMPCEFSFPPANPAATSTVPIWSGRYAGLIPAS